MAKASSWLLQWWDVHGLYPTRRLIREHAVNTRRREYAATVADEGVFVGGVESSNRVGCQRPEIKLNLSSHERTVIQNIPTLGGAQRDYRRAA